MSQTKTVTKLGSYTILLILLASIACKKSSQNAGSFDSRGVNFDLLMKTVDVYSDGKSITNYTYDNYKQIIQETSLRDFSDGTKWTVTNKWYRSTQDRLDSMTTEYAYGTDPTGLQKVYYHYDA